LVSKEQFEALERAHPLGFGTARDVANAVAFLLAGTGRWITGSTLLVDGGYSAQ
jgi:3-oxoacyl-[acyl-carrier protein] reductase